MSKCTRTEDTESEYSQKIESIKRCYCEGLLVDGDIVSKEAALKVFSRIKSRLKTHSIRKYRVVLRWYMAKRGIELSSDDLAIDVKKSVSKKAKQYPKLARDFLLGIIPSASWRNGEAKEFLMLHLKYGPLIGYRLSEVSESSVRVISAQSVELKIKNGKNSNGRANGEYRTLTLDKQHRDEDMFVVLSRLIELAQQKGVVESACRLHNYLRNEIPKELRPKGKILCMSSIRHEHILLSREVNSESALSASVGHINTETQKINYGRSSKSRGVAHEEELGYVANIQVSPSNIELVNAWLERRESANPVRRNSAPKR